jgi:DNA-directed RNA polymerase I, II, and III subunit RPABC5
MIIPTHCKSCGKVIGHLWFEYIKLVHQYQDADKLALSQDPGKVSDETPEARALNDLKIVRYCCRIMFLCQPEDLADMSRNRVQ